LFEFLNQILPKVKKPEDCHNCPYRWRYLDVLSDKCVSDIQNNCTIIKYSKGETICKQGTSVTHALYIAKGLVKVYIEGEKNLILKVIKAGDYIDLQTLFGDLEYHYSISAIEDSQICVIDSEVIMNIARNNPDYLYQITNAISDSSNYIFKKISSLSRKQLRGRLAEALFYFAEDIFESTTFVLPFSRQEMADFTSMSMENVVRILTEFKKEGVINAKNRDIEILQPDTLKRISDLG
jgi:CRP/FNR family transcriptional regulator